MDVTRNTPTTTQDAAEPQITLLATGYNPAVLNGQILAVPLHPDAAADTEYIPALIDGQVAAVPVYNPFAAAAAAQPQPAPVTPAPVPVVDPGLPLAVRQGVLLGCAGALAVGGLTWMVGAGIGEVGPYAHEIGTILMWAAITIAAVFVGLCALLGKFRSVTKTAAGTGTSGSATATGDGASATGTVLALVHRPQHHTTTIGKQTAWGRGGITNNNG
ncbi:hypothetical protein [Kitasatospora sp. NPDC087315]|uniref:hypothetical protein n=1 Tax=Kitasatospora sp. NPDC087315 TaxID=3364069 RepID=UPI00381126D8